MLPAAALHLHHGASLSPFTTISRSAAAHHQPQASQHASSSATSCPLNPPPAAGEYVARAFYSRNWQLRDAALQYLAELVRGGNVSDRRELCRSLVRLVVRSLRDKVPNVFFSTLPLLQALLATLAASASSREVSGLGGAV